MATKKLRLQVACFALEALSGSCNCVLRVALSLTLFLSLAHTLALIRTMFLSLSLPFFRFFTLSISVQSSTVLVLKSIVLKLECGTSVEGPLKK